jgi:hypothetical protein
VDVSALSLKIDSSDIVKATADLDKFAAASARAAAAAGRGGSTGSIAKMAQDYARAAERAGNYSSAAMRAAAANDNAAAAAERMAGANNSAARAVATADAHVVAYTQHLTGLSRSQGDANAHVVAYRDHLNKVGTALRFTARDGLNATRQLADIGTTAMLGMNPFLIAIQQGPQLFDILQEKAIATGTSIGTVFRAAGAAIWAAMAPLLPIILPIVAVIGLLSAGIAALTAQANNDSGLKKYTTAMGYTK